MLVAQGAAPGKSVRVVARKGKNEDRGSAWSVSVSVRAKRESAMDQRNSTSKNPVTKLGIFPQKAIFAPLNSKRGL